MTTHKLTLIPGNEILEVNSEESLLTQLTRHGKKIKSSCGGSGKCGDCEIHIKSGEKNLSPQTAQELKLLGNVFAQTKERLSCQTKIFGDVTIDISEHERVTAIKPLSNRPFVQEGMQMEVTQSAYSQIQLILEHDFTTKNKILRIQISGKGCGGFDYQLGFDHKRDDDIIIMAYDNQLTILMDPFTQFYTSDSTLDYVLDLVNDVDGFSLTNHNQEEHKGKFFKDTTKLPPWAVRSH